MEIRRFVRCFIVLIAALALAAVPASATVPNPTVTGPIPQGASPGDPSHDYIFFSSPLVPGSDYVEQEFFIEGTANVYNTPPLATGTIVSTGHPYRSRIVVRRPADPKRFNGTVILEWLNVSAGFDIDGWLSGIGPHLMREGYVWVGVSAQRVGIHQPGSGLKAWSSGRYGTLDVTDGGTLLNDELCYDVFSQAGRAVMHPVGVDPLPGFARARLVALGGSQSGFRLGIYYNSIQPLAGLVDGFVVSLANPVARGDLGVPLFKLHTETEARNIAIGIAPSGGPMPPLQADSDVVRTWQTAGASHVDGTYLDSLYPLAQRDGILLPPPGLCATPEGSRVPFYEIYDAAFGHMVRWVKDGVPPPTAPLIGITNGAVLRDARGLAVGGIRLATIAVPTALNTGVNSGPLFCGLFGTHIPFDQQTLNQLYPDHGTYVDAVQAAVDGNLAAGYIVQRDAQATVTNAAQSQIGSMKFALVPSKPGARLEQNTPNPFNPQTEIRYSVAASGRVQLTIFDVQGRRVRGLVDSVQERGEHRVHWNGLDESGRPVASGVYLYRLATKGFSETRKLVIKK